MVNKTDAFKTIILCLVVGAIFIALAELTHKMQKTQQGLTILYVLGVIVFARNIYAFLAKEKMQFRSFTFEHPYDQWQRVSLFFVSIAAVIGFIVAMCH